MTLGACALAALSACGRLGFDATSSAQDGGVDSASSDGATGGAARALSVSGYTTCAIVDGAVFCFGDNEQGQLGVGSTDDRATPTQLGVDRDWTAVATGGNHTCGIQLGGRLSCWGKNLHGQLGVGDVVNRISPVPVALPRPVIQVVVGGDHTFARLDDSSLWCWGRSLEGSCGFADGFDTPDVLAPQEVPGDRAWSDVFAGQGHSLAISDGQLYGTGRNTAGHLGLGNGAPGQLRTFTAISGLPPISHLTAGQDTSCVTAGDGTLWCWGDNSFGQQGDGTLTPTNTPTANASVLEWYSVDVDFWTTCGVTKAGVACMGRGLEGQFGDGQITDSLMPVLTFGSSDDDVKAVDAGRNHVCLLDAAGGVWCAGDNGSGELGTGDFVRRAEWTQVALP